tara:strand:+ start:544 stop:1380 length:837 start_codon:yes stop_codon:yes gene_type:complete
MGFKLRNNPITMKGSPVHLPGLGRVIKENMFTKGGTSAKRQAQGNFTKDELAAKRKAEVAGKQPKKDFTKDPNYGISPTVSEPNTSQQNFNKLMTLPNAVTQPPTNTPPKNDGKGKGKGKTTTSTKRKPIISDEAFEKRAKAQGQKPRDGKTKGRKVNITDAQFNKRAKAQGQKPTDGKAPKVDKVLSKRELRLANVKRKAANEKTRTNKTAQSIDTSKSKSADTGAKQTSARGTRSKAKRLENRATRIQGRIDRKGKSSAEKRASRKATRQKIRENR